MNEPPINIISTGLMDMLSAIEPSMSPAGERFWPCAAVLDDGRRLDRVTFVVNPRWRVPPGDVPVSRVVSLQASPWRLPAPLATKLLAAGESGQGYLVFLLALRTGQRHAYLVGNYLFDFLDLPAGVTSCDIVDVLPHHGRDLVHRHTAPQTTIDFVPPGATHPHWGRPVHATHA